MVIPLEQEYVFKYKVTLGRSRAYAETCRQEHRASVRQEGWQGVCEGSTREVPKPGEHAQVSSLVLYQKCIQYLCLCLLDGFGLHLNIYVCLDQYSLFSIRIEVMVIVYYFGPRIILIWVCDGFYTLGKLIFCRYASLCIRNNILSIWHYKWCCKFLFVCD